MELLQLKYFCDAARTENFSHTAKKFRVPPSDISQSIRRLEKELETELFTRQANRISLNEQGAVFSARIAEALDLIEDAVNTVTDDGTSGKIHLCVNTNRRIVMSAMEKFKKEYPQVNIKTKFLSDPTADSFDLIVTHDDKRLSGREKKLLIREAIALATPATGQLANTHGTDLSAFASAPFITTNEQSSLYEQTHSVCQAFGFQPRIAIQSDDPFYIRRCVELGLGVAIVPLFSWRGQFSKDIALKPLDGFWRNTFIYYDSRKYMPLCVRRFLNTLCSECESEEEV